MSAHAEVTLITKSVFSITFTRFSPDPFLCVTIEMSFGERRGAILLMKDNIPSLAPCPVACSFALAAGSPVREWCLWLRIGETPSPSQSLSV